MSIEKYKDMLYMERPISKHHAPMSMENRAAQFAPFAALTGYDDAVEEVSRVTSRKVELSEEMRAELDLILAEINSHIAEIPEVKITYFVPDLSKDGGEYTDIITRIKKIDFVSRTLILQDKTSIAIDDILSIEK